MPQLSLDHLYRETVHWDESVTWWENLGFSFAERWGDEPHRAGRLVCGAASVVLAEIGSDGRAEQAVFLATDDLETVADAAGESIVDTHWGTRMITLHDPDGRRYHIEPEDRP